MSLKPYTTKLDEKVLKALRAVSERTRISQAELVREGVELVLRRHVEDVVSPRLRQDIEDLLKEDRSLLQRLAED